MPDIGAMVDELIASGAEPAAAARIVARAFVAGHMATEYREESAADRRREYDRNRAKAKRVAEKAVKSVTERAESADSPPTSADSADFAGDAVSLSPVPPSFPPHPPNNPLTPIPIHSEPTVRALDAPGPRDFRRELFDRGLKTLAKLTGKGPDACRSFVGKCLKAAEDDAVVVLGLIEDAERNEVANASAWIVARLPRAGPDRPLTPYQESKQTLQDIRNDLRNFASTGGDSGGQNPRILRGDPGERPEGVRGGAGGAVIDLSPSGGRARG